MKAGQDLVIGGCIGIGGTVYATEKKAEVLRKRLSQALLDTAKAFRMELKKNPETAGKIEKTGISAEKVGEGGIFAALWNMAERYKTGFTVELRKIPVHQETIEICEVLELNPYGLLSGGCVLFAADNGNDVLCALEADGIFGAVIGKVTDSNDRLILNGETCAYLNRPAPDEIGKLRET